MMSMMIFMYISIDEVHVVIMRKFDIEILNDLCAVLITDSNQSFSNENC